MSFDIGGLDGAKATIGVMRMGLAWKEAGDFVDRETGAADMANKWKQDCVMLRLLLADGTAVVLWPSSDVNGSAPGHIFFNVEGEEGVGELKPSRTLKTYEG